MENGQGQAHVDQTLNANRMRRYGTLYKQTSAIPFLASDKTSYITGTVLTAAGGNEGLSPLSFPGSRPSSGRESSVSIKRGYEDGRLSRVRLIT